MKWQYPDQSPLLLSNSIWTYFSRARCYLTLNTPVKLAPWDRLVTCVVFEDGEDGWTRSLDTFPNSCVRPTDNCIPERPTTLLEKIQDKKVSLCVFVYPSSFGHNLPCLTSKPHLKISTALSVSMNPETLTYSLKSSIICQHQKQQKLSAVVSCRIYLCTSIQHGWQWTTVAQ